MYLSHLFSGEANGPDSEEWAKYPNSFSSNVYKLKTWLWFLSYKKNIQARPDQCLMSQNVCKIGVAPVQSVGSSLAAVYLESTHIRFIGSSTPWAYRNAFEPGRNKSPSFPCSKDRKAHLIKLPFQDDGIPKHINMQIRLSEMQIIDTLTSAFDLRMRWSNTFMSGFFKN